MSGLRARHLLVPLLLVAVAAGAYLTWLLRVELVVLFAAALFGMALHAVSVWLSDRTGLSHGVSVIIWYLTGIALAVGFFVFAGQRLSDEYGELSERIPSALESVQSRLEGKPILETLGEEFENMGGGMTGGGEEEGQEGQPSAEEERRSQERQMRFVRVTFRSLSLFVVWAVLAFFIAFDGRTYMNGLLRLVPPDHRDAGKDLMSSLTTALPWWLVGRLSSMAVVAALTAPGLLLMGIPLAFVLAIIAGLFSFVPFVGPVAAAIPAALVTLESAPGKLVWVLALYGGVQFLESNFITPRIQQYVASVPPLLLISAQLVLGVLVGIVGVMFATPLVLALMVAIQVVYLRHVLGEDVSTPHEEAA